MAENIENGYYVLKEDILYKIEYNDILDGGLYCIVKTFNEDDKYHESLEVFNRRINGYYWNNSIFSSKDESRRGTITPIGYFDYGCIKSIILGMDELNKYWTNERRINSIRHKKLKMILE